MVFILTEAVLFVGKVFAVVKTVAPQRRIDARLAVGAKEFEFVVTCGAYKRVDGGGGGSGGWCGWCGVQKLGEHHSIIINIITTPPTHTHTRVYLLLCFGFCFFVVVVFCILGYSKALLPVASGGGAPPLPPGQTIAVLTAALLVEAVLAVVLAVALLRIVEALLLAGALVHLALHRAVGLVGAIVTVQLAVAALLQSDALAVRARELPVRIASGVALGRLIW